MVMIENGRGKTTSWCYVFWPIPIRPNGCVTDGAKSLQDLTVRGNEDEMDEQKKQKNNTRGSNVVPLEHVNEAEGNCYIGNDNLSAMISYHCSCEYNIV
jgi:hypothetical protein